MHDPARAPTQVQIRQDTKCREYGETKGYGTWSTSTRGKAEDGRPMARPLTASTTLNLTMFSFHNTVVAGMQAVRHIFILRVGSVPHKYMPEDQDCGVE